MRGDPESRDALAAILDFDRKGFSVVRMALPWGEDGPLQVSVASGNIVVKDRIDRHAGYTKAAATLDAMALKIREIRKASHRRKTA